MSKKQLTDTVLMVQPSHFGFNQEAFASNLFQNNIEKSQKEIQQQVTHEFKTLVQQLETSGVHVVVYQEPISNYSPDAIFPNNWFSTHSSGELILYPMAVANRRVERRPDLIAQLQKDFGFTLCDMSFLENEGHYLEGTGSMIFDHANRVVYAAESPRTNREAVKKFCELMNYQAIIFRAYGKDKELIYHTNVMMCVGESFIAIGLDTINDDDRSSVEESINKSGKEVITLSNDQIYSSFAGNMLQVQSTDSNRILVLSDKAYNSLTKAQLSQFNSHTDLMIRAKIPMIENVGGGSARCMLAEIFRPNFDNFNS